MVTGVRADPTQIRTVLYMADRGDALTALESYVTLIDGNPYEFIQHGQSWGFYRILKVVGQPIAPCAVAAGTLLVTQPRYMPLVFIAKAMRPAPSMAISPPSPPMEPMSAMVAEAADCTVSPRQAMRSQSCRAAPARMKNSPDPVAETAQFPSTA